jgi:hypothetical protein
MSMPGPHAVLHTFPSTVISLRNVVIVFHIGLTVGREAIDGLATSSTEAPHGTLRQR